MSWSTQSRDYVGIEYKALLVTATPPSSWYHFRSRYSTKKKLIHLRHVSGSLFSKNRYEVKQFRREKQLSSQPWYLRGKTKIYDTGLSWILYTLSGAIKQVLCLLSFLSFSDHHTTFHQNTKTQTTTSMIRRLDPLQNKERKAACLKTTIHALHGSSASPETKIWYRNR